MTASQLLSARPGVAADAEAAFLVQAVRSGCGLMLGLINSVLETRHVCSAGGIGDSSAATQAPLMLRPSRFALRPLLESVLQTCRVGCGLLRGRLEWVNEHEAGALPEFARADADRVAQVLQSVVVYSLQHSPGDAPLTFSARVAPGEPGTPSESGSLCAEVRDPARRDWAEECARIFSPGFVSSQDAGSCSALALYVARAVARAMGSDVCAECAGDDSGGSVLRVCLPLGFGGAGPDAEAAAALGGEKRPPEVASPSGAPAERLPRLDAPPPPPLPQPDAGPRPRCLLVDDHELNVKLVRRLLELHGFDVSTAVNGLDALQQLQASSLGGAPGAPPAPDIALVDLQVRASAAPSSHSASAGFSNRANACALRFRCQSWAAWSSRVASERGAPPALCTRARCVVCH